MSFNFLLENNNSQQVIPDNEKLKRVERHEDTFVSKQSLRIEKKILIDLNTILKFFKDKYLDSINQFNYQEKYEDFKRITEREVYNIFRSGSTAAYQLGTAYVTDSLNTVAYLTKSDIEEIELITDSYSDRFYGRIQNALKSGLNKFYKKLGDVPFLADTTNLHNEDANEVLSNQIEKSGSYIFSSLAVLLVTESLNKATINKSRKLLPNEFKTINDSNILSGSILHYDRVGNYVTSNDLLAERLLNYYIVNSVDQEVALSDQFTHPRIFQSRTTVLQWKTSTKENVCPICKPLSDRIYLLSADVPIPGLHTHHNCRCRVMLIRF